LIKDGLLCWISDHQIRNNAPDSHGGSDTFERYTGEESPETPFRRDVGRFRDIGGDLTVDRPCDDLMIRFNTNQEMIDEVFNV
jgi:hypothetical protein